MSKTNKVYYRQYCSKWYSWELLVRNSFTTYHGFTNKNVPDNDAPDNEDVSVVLLEGVWFVLVSYFNIIILSLNPCGCS